MHLFCELEKKGKPNNQQQQQKTHQTKKQTSKANKPKQNHNKSKKQITGEGSQTKDQILRYHLFHITNI